MIWLYLGFVGFILGLLALDLGVFHRRDKLDSVKAALGWSALWISLGLTFSAVIYLGYEQHWLGLGTGVDGTATARVSADGTTYYNDGGSAMVKYLTGFFVEKSLAIDNIFVIAMIFAALKVPAMYQHRVLFWGILGALVMRGLMIGAGAALITRFAWIIYVFGGFLILTGVKMLLVKDDSADLADGRLVRLIRRLIPITERFHGPRFLVRAGTPAAEAPATPDAAAAPDRVVAAARRGARLATPLFLALVLVEFTDLIFAVDSIPAIFAITTDPFLVFTSNVFAMLGLRSLYFALAGMMDRFRYLKPALAAVLVIIGGKMLTHGHLKAWLGESFNFYVIAVVLSVIATGVLTSLFVTRREALAAQAAA
ncbi:MAG: TerC/Alx family metal homeostasis membrane protein [Myxococcales bacterium]|nr:TerC/Alx family metal homeostasis membrane protein [Myxococcales bacterium]